MQPLFTYNIPSTSWYIVVTDTSNHFYFNNDDKCSYWQLYDLQEQYDIDIPKFVESINYDELSVLMAKSRGVNIELKDEKEEVSSKSVGMKEDEIIIENVQSTPVVSSPPQQQEKAQAILAGYSSSEDDEEEEEEEKKKDKDDYDDDGENEIPINIDEITEKAIAQYKSQEDEQSSDDEDDNNSLDLSLDDNDSSNSIKQDFMNLLNQCSGKFSIYDSWDLIEEELIEEFVKYPEFLAISSKQERENIFQKWCSQQEQEEGESNNDVVIEENTGIFPTPKIKFLEFLQDFKSDIKDSFYQSFYASNYIKINEFDLSPTIKESIFRNYKLMLNNFTKFAKNFKKQNKNSNQNVKVMKLNEFLKGKLSGSFIINDNLSHFDNWINLLNENDISAEIAENEINFLVGDEKRLNSYIEQLQ
ncbi:predicted protein [Candida tropicalis MYA-3404]|uniref:FF domain-containing protein n=1 Tax=Candida tropicalis (strain ATCC MYA-3404 / T1) TaxID=294747 RepID=C5M808_CANTT|nr:predicted protein [Candida tropicalis MYA-3404]EER33712.1 predicted protein [Candida tropicalis MYA-3404]KAG4407558.1 hypothetical protein JTP64_003093 [Candida tropicalis]